MKLTPQQKWALLLGEDPDAMSKSGMSADWKNMGAALDRLYGGDDGEGDGDGGSGSGSGKGGKKGGKGKGTPSLSKWLGDIRSFFPNDVVQVMQKDAMDKFGIDKILLNDPEMAEQIEPDVNLVSTIMSLSQSMPAQTKETARIVVQKVVDALVQKLQNHTQNAIRGALNRSITTLRPRHNEINWNKTIKANLRHYQLDYNTIIPEKRFGFGHRRPSLKNIVLCIDRSGSMGNSVVYSSIFAAVMASLPSVKTHMVVFDTEVVDFTDELEDPVDVLFGIQLGGGTDINRALAYCETKIVKPQDTVLMLISDLYEGGNNNQMLQRCKNIVNSGVKMIALLALDDEGAPYYDRYNAEYLSALNVPCFACTPNLFPDMMATALTSDISAVQQWVERNIVNKKDKS